METFAGNNPSIFDSQALKLGKLPAYKTIINVELEQANHQILSNNERNGP